MNIFENIRIRLKKRYTKVTTSLLGFPINMIDKSSFLYMYQEIFEEEIYKFISKNNKPKIIDCGANIGLSVIYFKKLYPESEIIAFEPDPKIFNVLQSNIKSGNFKNVELIKKGVSNKQESVAFIPDNSDGGRLVSETNNQKQIFVETIKLSDYLSKKVDFLKIDIEGEEVKVMEECQNLLKNVENIFVEYHSFVSQEQELHKLLKILYDSGFRYYIRHVGYPEKQLFIKRPLYANMDMQLNIYARRQ